MKATTKGPLALYTLLGQTAVGALALLLIVIFCALTLPGPSRTIPGEAQKAVAQEVYGRLPLYFIENEGQLDKSVKYYERGLGHAIFFTDKELLFHFETGANPADAGLEGESRRHSKEVGSAGHEQTPGRTAQVRLWPVMMQEGVNIEGLDPQEGKVNYFLGKDPATWKTNIPTYRSVVYREAYPGVDLKFYGSNERLEYDVIVNAGADPAQVKFGYSGIQSLRISDEGDLQLLLLDGGKLIHKKPIAYQEINGKRHEVEGAFSVEPFPGKASSDEQGPFVFGFKLAAYDPAYPLVIDPVLVYSSYLGGAGIDQGYAIAVDTSGYAYVTGRTYSTSFPTQSSLDSSLGGTYDAFVTKLNLAGTALVYSTYLGGSGLDWANAIAVDSSGYAYLTGETTSTDFPTTSSPYSSGLTSTGYSDAFVVKLSTNGSTLSYATYLGGSWRDAGLGIAVDGSGLAYVTGQTSSYNDFPIEGSAYQSAYGQGTSDAFVTKFNASGTDVTYSTYWGGNDADAGNGIAVDSSYIYVVGQTASTNFPTAFAQQNTYGGGASDAFVVKIARSSLDPVYASYLGGTGNDYGLGIAIESDGSAYVTGSTSSSDFPLVNAFQETLGGGSDAFVTKFTSDGDSLSFSTYLGGSGDDIGYAIAADTKGNAYVVGKTTGSFPTNKAVQSVYGGSTSDAFAARIDCTESELAYSTYLGGSGVDVGHGIALGTGGNVYVTGWSSSINFPTTAGAFMQTSAGGNNDAFVTKINALLADFTATPTSGLYPLVVAFTDASQGAVTGWSWDFGDGSTPVTTQNPTHEYQTAGSYTVSLTVTGTGGEDTKTRTNYIKIAVPEVTIAATTASVSESGGGSGQFTVYRSAYTSVDLTVNYTVTGTATPVTDYPGLSGSVTIPSGSSSAVISVTPVWDKINDGDETVVVTLSGSSLYSVGSPDSATVTIVDHDLPTVTVSASVASVAETSTQNGLFVVSRAGVTTNALTVYYTVSGTATAGTDYTPLASTVSVTIDAGLTSASIAVDPLHDNEYDGDKSVILTLASNSLYTVASPSSATVTIVDSDLPVVTIEATTSTVPETGSPGTYVVTHTGTTSKELIVNFAVSGTAVKGTNFVDLGTSVRIPAGSASATITLTPIRDNEFTGNLTVVVSLTASSLYSVGSPNTATITIIESDLPKVTVTATQPNATEATVTGQFTVSRSGNTASALTVAYTTGGTAKAGTNYTALEGTVTIAAGAKTQTITVQPLDESLWQGPTTVILSITANTSLYTIGSPGNATVTIADNDGPAITIAATRPTVWEADTTDTGLFTVTRSAHTDVAVTVTYTVTGTATYGTDYVRLQGTMEIPAGFASGSIQVTPLEDFVSDGDKTVVVTISSSDWYKIGSPSSATVTIRDSDLPTVTIAATVPRVLEQGSQKATFAVTRAGSTTSAMTVGYTTGGTAISGTDYTAPSGTVNIAAGSSSAIIEVTPLADGLYDGNQTLVLTVAGGSTYNVGSPGSATATIVDQDVPTVTITASVPTVEESTWARGEFLVTHSGITIYPLTVTYSVGGTATKGVDYVSLTNTVTIPAGSSSFPISVEPFEDSIPDDAESVVVTLVSSSLYTIGSPNAATVTIYESGSPTVSIVATNPIAKEGGSAGQFTVYRTKMTTEELAVAYSIDGSSTAVPDGHYSALSGSVIIPIGSASATIDVQAIENTVYEGPKTVILTLLPSALYELGSASSATVTVADNDGPSVQLEAIVSKTVGYETGQVAAQVKVYRPAGNTTGAIPVAYSMGGTATNGEDFDRLSGTIVIPDGSASAIIEMIPIDDSLDEDRETVIFTLAENGWYTIGWKTTDTVYISDNDLPGVTVAAIDDNASEAGSNDGTFRLTRNGVTTSSLLVYYTVGGTATNGSRYEKLNGSITIYAGSSYADIIVSPYNDTTYQGNETVTVTILSTDLYQANSPDSATVTIYENDMPTVTITAPVGAVDENGAEAGVFRVSRNGAVTLAPPLEVSYSVASSSTAVYGIDYDASFSGSVTIPAGKASVDLEITPLNNEIQDGTRSVILNLSSSSSYTLGTSKSAVVSILDDEMPSVTIVAVDELASENATDNGTIRIFRSGDLSAAMEVTYSVDGTAVPGTHYTALPTSVTIPANESSIDLVVSALEDQTAQLDKTVIVTLSSSADYYVGSPNQATVAIVDDDTPVISVTAVRNATESGTKGQFKFSRVGNTHVPLVVRYTVGGTAVKNVNYKAIPVQITIPEGKASKILQVTPIDDNETTGDLTVELTLKDVARYQLGSSESASISITDNDLPKVSVVATAPYAIESGIVNGSFTITRSRVTDSALTVKYSVGGTAKSGVDYKKLSGTLNIPKGQASKVVNVVPIDDNKTDVNRTVELTITDNAAYFLGTPSTDVVNISDSGLPEVSLTVADKIAALPSDTGTFTVSRIGATTDALKVYYIIGGTAKNGTDYKKLSGKATIPIGASSVNVKVRPLADGEVLDNETVILTLATDSTYTLSTSKKGTVTILGSRLPVVNVTAKNPTASEIGPAAGSFTVTRTGSTTSAATIAYTLSGTATNGKDYQRIVGTVDIPMGASFVDLSVMPKTDALTEGSETVILTITPTLRYIVGTSGTATVTIMDN